MLEVAGSIPTLGKTFCCFLPTSLGHKSPSFTQLSDIIMFTTTMQADANASRQMQMHLDENASGQIQMHLDKFKCI